MIHIALAIHDPNGTYARHAGVVIASVLRNTGAPVCFHIMHDETLSSENRLKLEETRAENCSGGHSEINFIDMSAYFSNYPELDIDHISGVLTRGTLYRLSLPEVVVDVDKIIYLDCDVAVNLDVAQLWEECAAMDSALAGVRELNDLPMPDISLPKEMIKKDEYGVTDDRYINAGVIVMNLSKMRRESEEKGALFQRAVKYITEYDPQHKDQDFLNAEYLGDIMYLDQKYNDMPFGDYDDVFNLERIWHFFSKGKPWNVVRGSNADMLYWQNLMHTPWRGELVESFYNAAVNGKYYHRHSRECIDRLLSQLIENIKNVKRVFKRNSR